MISFIRTTFGKVNAYFPIVDFSKYVFFQEGPGLRNWQWTDSGMKVINVTNILGDGSVDTSNTDRFIAQYEFETKYSHFAIEENDILIASSGNTYGNVGRIRNVQLPVMMNTSVIRFHPQDNQTLSSNYLYAYVRSPLFRNQIEQFVIGSAQPNFGPYHLNRMKLVLPSYKIQQKIAAILSAYDDLIENNTRRIKILEEMAQATYREWFVHFRFPGHEGVRMVESELGLVPEEWEVVPITDIANILSGGTPKTTESLYWGGNIPFFSPKDASDNFYIISTDSHITELGLKKCNSQLFPKNTVIITARGTVGKVIMPAVNMAMNQSCYALAGRDGLSQIFLFLLTRESTNYFKKNTGGATFETIVIDTFRRFKVVKPSKETIKLFSEIEKPIFDMIENLLWKNANFRRTLDLLLPILISGKIDVSGLDIRIPEAEA